MPERHTLGIVFTESSFENQFSPPAAFIEIIEKQFTLNILMHTALATAVRKLWRRRGYGWGAGAIVGIVVGALLILAGFALGRVPARKSRGRQDA